jgi:hypothetical protein
VAGLERKPVGRAEVKDTHGNVVPPAADVDENMLECWGIKAERAANALKTAMSLNVKDLIRDGKNDPGFIWDMLKTSFIQQRTAPCFNVYHALHSDQKLDSKWLEGLINRVDEHIRIIIVGSKSIAMFGNFGLFAVWCYTVKKSHLALQRDSKVLPLGFLMDFFSYNLNLYLQRYTLFKMEISLQCFSSFWHRT